MVRALSTLLLMAVFNLSWVQAADSALESYRLNTGDTVKILVFDEQDLSVTERISDRGNIAYPLLGELKVAGLTLGQLQELITKKLKGRYLIDPKVSVSVTEYRQVHVMGEVQRPGGFAYLPGLTVRKAISLAGGFSERASRNKIFLIQDNDATGTRARVGEDAILRPGDTIIVEESFF